MNLGVVLAIAAAVGYGAADFVGGLGSRRHSSWQVVVVGQLFGAAAMFVVGLVARASPQPSDFAWALIAGAGSATGGVCLFRGLASGSMSLVAPLSAVGAAALPVVFGAVLGERPSSLTWAGMVGALPGIWLVSREDATRNCGNRRAAVDGALAGIGFGVLFIALSQISADAGTLPLAVNQLVGAILTMAAATMLGQRWRPHLAMLGWGSAAGALGVTGTLAFTLAAGITALGTTSVIASLYPAVTVVLAATVLHVRLDTGQRVGISICVVSIATLA